MPYTVSCPGGNNESEFRTYVRLLRQSGVDIGNLPRVPEPGTRRKWLYVWHDRAAAEAFRTDLAEQTSNQNWQVAEVFSPPSEGPLGPLIVQTRRQHGQFAFELHPLSRHLIRTAFPEAVGVPGLTVAQVTYDEFRRGGQTYRALVNTLLPALTGLNSEQLEQVGYYVQDADTETTEVYVPPVFPVAA